MNIEEIKELDNEGSRFTVDGYRGIAFYFYDEEFVNDEDTIWTGMQTPTGNAVMIMVGDDRKFIVDPEDVEAISDDDYCPECGQIGCKAYG